MKDLYKVPPEEIAAALSGLAALACGGNGEVRVKRDGARVFAQSMGRGEGLVWHGPAEEWRDAVAAAAQR